MQVSDLYNSASSMIGTTSNQSQVNGSSAMDTSKFMELLMAQLTHQNPMEPMKDQEMMSQMAQLNSLQELQMIKLSMQEMANANQTSYAASLIGKNVRSEIDGKTIEGLVTGITMEAGKASVHIGENVVPLNSIIEITAEKPNG